MPIKIKKDSSGNFVQENPVTAILTQAQLDAQAQYASAAAVDPYTAQKIKNNAAYGSPMSAGTLVALSRIGGDVNSQIGNNIATIDAQTRETRTANQQDLAQKRADEDFQNSKRGQAWKFVKGLTFGAVVVGESIYNALNAQYRTSLKGLEQTVKGFGVGGYTAARGQDIQLKQEEIEGVPQQTLLGQIAMKSAKDLSKGNLPQLELGQGFFPNETLGEAKKARDVSLSAAKIAVRDSKGKVIGYQPRNILGDAYSNIFTLGKPESAGGAVISMVADAAGSFVFDAGLGYASEIKALKKMAAQARAKGAMDQAAVFTERLDKVTAAQKATEEARTGALSQLDSIPEAEATRAAEAAAAAKAIYTDKTNAAAKNSSLVKPAIIRQDETIAWTKARQAELDDAKKALAEANSVVKAPKEISKVESQLAAKTKELKELKKSVKDAGGSYRVEVQPGYFQVMDKDAVKVLSDEVSSLKTKLDDLKTVGNPVNPVSSETVQELVERIAILNANVKEGNKAITAAGKQIEERIKNAKRAARAEEASFNDYVKTRKKDRKLSEIMKDKTISYDEKLTIWKEQVKNLSGIKAADGTVDFSYDKIADFLTGGFGSAGLDRLVGMTDWKKIWRASGKKIDSETARALAAAETPEEVISVVAPYILRGGKGTSGMLKPGIIQRAGENFSERTAALGDSLSFMLPAAKVLTGPAARIQHRMMHHEKVAQLFNGFESGVKGQIALFGKPLKTAYQTKVRAGALINIKDTDALLETVEDFGKAIKLDNVVLDKLLDDIATGATSATRGYTASVKLLESAFKQFEDKIPAKMQEDWRRITKAFEQSNEEMANYWASRHAKGAHLEYITVNKKKVRLSGPHLESELLNGTIYIPSPAEFLKFTSKLARLPGGNRGIKIGDTLITNWWKKSVLVRPAFIIRNIGEEQLRVFGTGHISLYNNPLMAIAMWMGREEGPNWRKMLYAFDNYKHTIFDKNFSTGDDISDLVNETMAQGNKNSYVDMMAADKLGSFDDNGVRSLQFKGIAQVPYGHKRFFDGVANELRILNSDEMTRVVSGLTPKQVADAVATGVTREDAVVDYFFSGQGRKTLENFYSAYGDEVQSWLKTRDGVKEYLYTGKLSDGKDGSVLSRVIEATGGNSSLRQMVAYGKAKVADVTYAIPRADTEAINSISNSKQIAKGRKALLDSQAEFAKKIQKTFESSGKWDDVMMNVPSRNIAFAEGKLDKPGIVEKFFDVATKLEKNSTFGPEFRQAYWDAINEIALALDAKAVAKLEEVAQSSLSPLQRAGLKKKPELFPGLKQYPDGGNGGLPGTRSTVGFVKIEALKDMPGNKLSNFEGIDALRKSLREGKGFATRDFQGKPFQDPIMVVYDNETGLAYIGEGNHRLQAAMLENIPYVPVRVVRGSADEMVASGGRKPQQIKNNKEPQFPETTGPNIGKVRDPEYIPPTMHPSYVFDKKYIVEDAATGSTYGKNHPVWNAFRVAKGDGPLSIEDAHAYADRYARNHVKELFYNASERRLIFHQLRLIGPFMNAWEDTIRKWGEIGLENPVQVYKGIKTLEWLESPESSAIYQVTDARDYYNPNEGFFFKDPGGSGQQLFWVPFTGTVLSKFAGALTGNNFKGAPIAFATNPMSFNFAVGSGSILPGMGPGITVPINALATWNQSFADNLPEGIKNWLFPFGRSDFSSGPLAAILPSNWNRIIGGAVGVKDTYASTFKPIMAYLAGGNNYNLDNPDDQSKLMRDTDVFARWFGIMRGVTGLVAPSALQVKGITSDGNGDAVTQIALYNDFQEMLVNNDNNYNKTVADFLDLYGVTAVFAIISSSAGNAPSNWDSYKFVTKNPDVANKYGDIWGYVYPGGGLSQEMYKWNLVNNTKKQLTSKEMLEKANNLRYYAALDGLLAQVDNGYLDKDQFKEAKNYLKASMGGGPKSSSDFNKFSRVVYQLKTLTEDKRFVEVPAVAGLRDYMYLRDKALSILGKGSTDKMLGSSDEVMAQRAWLSEQAVWIIQDNPDFQKIFYQFFADELEGK